MKLNKSKKTGLNKAVQGVAVTKQQSAVLKQHLNSLNAPDDESEEQEGSRNQNKRLPDPTHYLNKKQLRQWNKLSPRQKKQYMPKESNGHIRPGKKRKKYAENSLREAIYLNRDKHQKRKDYKNRQQNIPRQGAVPDRHQNKSMNNSSIKNKTQNLKSDTKSNASTSVITGTSKAKTGAAATAKTGAATTAGAATGGATLGVSVAVDSAQRTADKFKEALQRKAEAQSYSIRQAQQAAQDELDNKSKGTSTFEQAGTKAFVKLAPVLLIVMQFGIAVASAMIALLIPIIILVVLVSIVVAIFTVLFSGVEESISGQYLVDVALTEYANSSHNIGGTKYKSWYGLDDNWCVMFITWCADECGYLDDGVIPRTASVSSSMEWYKEHNLWQTRESGYKPKAGDIIHFASDGMSHAGIVIEYDEQNNIVTTVEGNSGTSSADPYHKGSRVTKQSYFASASRITGYGTPIYPLGNAGEQPLAEGERIAIPNGLGSVHTYMGWSMITSTSSLQYKLRNDAGENYDGEGFAKIGTRYVIACTTTFGKVGDYIDFYQKDGTVIECIIGDIKSQGDPGCTKWGHLDGTCIIEFVVDKSTWYGTRHPNPGTALCHPEWNQTKTKAVNRGNYWGNR